MKLEYKPDFDETSRRWHAYWAGEIIDRPVACIRVWTGENQPVAPTAVNGLCKWDEAFREFDAWASQMLWLGEAVPFLNPNFGPDMYAAWLGGSLYHSSFDQERTSWAVPVVEDWGGYSGRLQHPTGEWWEEMLAFMRSASDFACGRFVVGVPDVHSNMDALAALRGPERLCLDLLDTPEQIDLAMAAVRRSFAPIFEGVEEAGGLASSGYIGWLPFYCEKRFAVIQCDFICMISPEHFRRWVMPALEEESSYLEHCVYHLDGPDALVHLEDILSIPGIDAIQWVPGMGNPPPIEWMDLLVRIQDAGKGLYLGASPEEVKLFHKTLRPEGILYDLWGVSTAQEADDLLEWLRTHT